MCQAPQFAEPDGRRHLARPPSTTGRAVIVGDYALVGLVTLIVIGAALLVAYAWGMGGLEWE